MNARVKLVVAAALLIVAALGVLSLLQPGDILKNSRTTKNYIVHTDLDEKGIDFYERVFEGFRDYFDDRYYKIPDAARLPIHLFSKASDYTAFSRRTGGPETPFGYYSWDGGETCMLVVNLESGLGTATHELVHHFVRLGFDAEVPSWINEGFAAFFEKFMGYVDANGKLVVSFGYFSDWRFPITKREIEDLRIEALTEARDVDQCAARDLMLFLHRKRLLKTLIAELRVRKDDPRGVKTLEKIWGKPLDDLETSWKQWVRSQPVDDDVNLVPASFIMTEKDWNAWWETARLRLEWSDEEERYRPRRKQ
jgi:hypothetical protein